MTHWRQPLTEPVDLLLADVAIRVQLSRTDYGKAVERYETINEWIEREDSPLKDRVHLFYPQGSMAIGRRSPQGCGPTSSISMSSPSSICR